MDAANVRAIVLDIEGTTSSIAFVKEQLFPFARSRIPAYVRDHESEVRDILDQVRSIEGNERLGTPQLIDVPVSYTHLDVYKRQAS